MIENQPIALTTEQKTAIVDFWNNKAKNAPSIPDLCQLVYGYPYAATSKWGKEIRGFLIERGIKNPSKEQKIHIPDGQKDFILKHAHTTSPVELARLVFDRENITPFSKECVLIKAFIEENAAQINQVDGKEEDEEIVRRTRSPKTVSQVLKYINKYCKTKYKEAELSSQQEKNAKALLHNMNTVNYRYALHSFENDKERELFESSFVRYTHDKYDLSEEESDMYVGLCVDHIEEMRLQKQIAVLSALLDNAAVEDENGKAMRMSLIESLDKARQSLDRNRDRKQKNVKALTGNRADKLKNQASSNIAVTNLVGMWQDEEKRKELLRLGMMEKEALKDSVGHIHSMDALLATLNGMSEEEFIHGNNK